ncbi:MAG: hypothetical protein Q9227_008193 [Pyrenula ochraceoflavens]
MARTNRITRRSTNPGDEAIVLTGQAKPAKSELNAIEQNNETEVKGMICEPINLYQKRDEDGNLIWTDEYPKNLHDPVENSETAKYALLVRNTKCLDGKKKLQIQSIQIQSPLLREALGMILDGYPGVTTTLEKLTFSVPFAPFVHRWLKFVDVLDSMEDGEMKDHLNLLHDILSEELKETIAAKVDLVANGVIDFVHMWTIFEPGCLIYGAAQGYDRVYELRNSQQGCLGDGTPYINLRCWSVDWDGDKFGSKEESLYNYGYEGTVKITQLPYYPLTFHPDRNGLEGRLLSRGRTFESLKGYHYMAYKGVALGYGRCGMIKHSVDSRIIIDTEAHNKFLPNNAVSFSPLPASNDGTPVDTEGDYDEDDDLYDDYDESNYSKALGKPTQRALTRKELLLTVPFVRGYALKTKKWLHFFVNVIQPITFSSTAFSSLVLPSEQKELILAFVESQVRNKHKFDDVIAGKGRGMILLLSGPPGVGKTLTAESVAENMHVPLYMMSAGDLGLNPSGIEDALSTILEMVAKWNAVLLLDEADVFLEQRDTHDLERNKMVSIFLRVLEYYEGILFLTTNRIKNIDDAFHSRIHVAMRYPDLTVEGRRKIWAKFAEEAGSSLSEGNLDELSKEELNGRQIKNVLKTAGMLAMRWDENGKVSMDHVRTVMAIERSKDFS